MYNFSADVSCSSNFDVTLRSAARTIPSFARIPMAVPAWEMASSAYSTWYRRPSGEKMVVYPNMVSLFAWRASAYKRTRES
ncbi:hypothetical protein F4679DRAFT_532333 [Xylaria curta]|nr:hypothetical protein F4679DRAFT_532333 [Xylaria curta]